MKGGGVRTFLFAAALAAARLASGATLTRGPYLQLLGTRSVTVVWRTNTPARCALKVHAVGASDSQVSGERGTRCALRVDGLTPGTSYGYVPLADGAALTEESVFQADDPAAPFAFLVLGDSGCGCATQLAMRERMMDVGADLIVHTGDMVYEQGAAEDFDAAFFAPYAPLLRRLVLWPTLGNHDVRTASGQPWRDAFWTPANNSQHSEDYYSFDHGNAHFVVLNSSADTAPGSPQHSFLDADLAASRATWKFVVFHHTIYSSGYHGSNLKLRANLLPLLDRYAVDVVFMGHDHDYERTLTLHGDRIVRTGEGTVYITTGGGGGELRPVARSEFTAYAESHFHFVRIAIDGRTLTARMIRDDGTVGDELTLAKR